MDGKQSAHLGPQPHSPFRLGAEVRSLSTTTRWKLVCSAGYDMKNTLTYHVKVCTSDWHIIERWRVTEMSWKTKEKHRNIRYHDLSMEISEFGRALFWDSPTSMKMRYHGIKKVMTCVMLERSWALSWSGDVCHGKIMKYHKPFDLDGCVSNQRKKITNLSLDLWPFATLRFCGY